MSIAISTSSVLCIFLKYVFLIFLLYLNSKNLVLIDTSTFSVPLPSHKDQPKTVNKKVPQTESKPTAKQSDTGPKVTSQQPTKQEKTTPSSKQPQKTTKASNSESQKDQQKTKVNPKQTSKSSASSIKPTSFGLPQTVPKLEKVTPYEFISAWNSLKQSTDMQPYADLLRQIPPADLPKG